MMPTSATRFIDPSSIAIAAVKFAPFRKSARAITTAAYEHDEDAAPNPQAVAIVPGRRRRTLSDLSLRNSELNSRASLSLSRIGFIGFYDAYWIRAGPARLLSLRHRFARRCFEKCTNCRLIAKRLREDPW